MPLVQKHEHHTRVKHANIIRSCDNIVVYCKLTQFHLHILLLSRKPRILHCIVYTKYTNLEFHPKYSHTITYIYTYFNVQGNIHTGINKMHIPYV